MLLSTAFAYSRGRCCAVANLEVSLRTFTYTAVAQEKKFVFISYKCNGHFKSVFVWRGCGGRVGRGKEGGGEKDWREREMLFMRLVLLASLWVRARDRAIVVSNGTMGLF